MASKCEMAPEPTDEAVEDSSRSSADTDVELTSLNWLHNLNIIPSLLPTPPSSPTLGHTAKSAIRLKNGKSAENTTIKAPEASKRVTVTLRNNKM